MPRFDPVLLARFLAEASDADNVGIGDIALLPGGAIRENWGFDAEFVGGAFAGRQRLVLRSDAATGIPSSLGRLEEFAVLQAAYAAGVRVPEPLFACADPRVIGRPFFVMRRVAGIAQGRRVTSDPALEPALPQIADRLGRELAQIQTIRPPHAGLAFLPMVGPAEHIASLRAYLDRHPQPRPVLEWAISWLDSHLPEPLAPVLCHRDFRTGNYMLAPTLPSSPRTRSGDSGGGSGWGLTGILDWEFAGWGDPDEDIGWFCCKGWRFARLDRPAGGIAARAPFYAGYERAAGRRLDPQRVYFWEVLANVRWAVIALQQSDRYLLGGARDLSTAIIGRRATECELELLILLDPEGAPANGPLACCPHAGGGRNASGPNVAFSGGIRDLPSGAQLLLLGRDLLLAELLPLLPAEHKRAARLVATAMAVAAREAMAGNTPAREILARLKDFYGEQKNALSAPGDGEGDPAALLRRFAHDLRVGTFQACEEEARVQAAARALLWRMTMVKLREGNPLFLAANGLGA